MLKFASIHKANEALPDLGRGQVVLVAGRKFRKTGRTFKVVNYMDGEKNLSRIPGYDNFNRSSNGFVRA